VKVLLTIVQDTDAPKLQKALIEGGFSSTKLASTGGFLRAGNTTFIIGVDDHKVAEVKEIVGKTCQERIQMMNAGPTISNLEDAYLSQPLEVKVGGAIIFVVNVEEFSKL
jgi:uncharacterized protein YaaQ